MTQSNGGPAFPCLGNVSHNSDWVSDDGMSLRDWFAGQVLPQCFRTAIKQESGSGVDRMAERASMWSYKLADAMLAEREKGGA